MGTLLRTVLVFFLCTIVLAGLSSAQKKTDALQRANELLKNYKPPAPTNPAPTETPAQAWQKYYKKLDARTGKQSLGNGPSTAPRNEQYHSKGSTFKIQQQVSDLAAPKKSVQEMRAAIQAQIDAGTIPAPAKRLPVIRDDAQQRNATVEAYRLAHPTNPALNTPDQIKSYSAQHIRDLEAVNKSAAAPKTGLSTNGVGAISGVVYADSNHNNVKDANEPGLAGVTVHINGYYYALSLDVITDADGVYYADNPNPADYLFASVAKSSAWQPLNSYSYQYTSGDTLRNRDIALWPITNSNISGTVYNDLNHNGSRDDGEPGIEGSQVRIYRYWDGAYIYPVTDANGFWSFSDTVASQYWVQDVVPTGWLQTGGSSTYYTNVLYGDSVKNYDFGNWKIGWFAIRGMKFNDLNHDGVHDPGEPGLPGWTINLYEYYTGKSVSTVTNADGFYELSDSGYASYVVVTESNQDGWLPINPSNGNGHAFYVMGDTTTGMDFSNWFVPNSAIRGMAWNDLNNNGQYDDGEPPLIGWNVIAYKETPGNSPSANEGGGGGGVGDTIYTVTDSSGHYEFKDLTWVSYYKIWVQPTLDWLKTYPSGDYWRPYVAGDTVENVDFGFYLPEMGELRVNTLPSNGVSVTYANAVANQPLAVWGNVHGGVVPLTYWLDYGDGNIDSGTVTNRHYTGTDHVYGTAGPKTVILKVRDANGVVDSSVSIVRVYAFGSKQIRINMAIEKGLLYNYLNQYPDGHWYDGYSGIGATGASLLAFEENGHLPDNDVRKDIYAEWVRLGLDYLEGTVHTFSIYAQTQGNPDSDGDGLGAYFNDGENYANGIASLAFIGAHKSANSAKSDTIRVGIYSGQTFFDLMTDVLDQICFSQNDPEQGNARGGWQYSVATSAYGNSDNSATQWPGLVIEALENSWGMAVPQFVRDEFKIWLKYSQDETGGFAYTSRGYWNNVTKTGAGIGGFASLGYTTDSVEIINAINFMDQHWGQMSDNVGYADVFNGNLYGMYAVAKGLRIINHRVPVVNVGSHNWYDEFSTQLLDHAQWGQQSDGHWNDQVWVGSWANSKPLTTAFAILVLTQGVIVPPPVAIIQPVGSVPPNEGFQVDGSGSFHQDPSKSIVEWLWDFNSANGIDWNHPDASGQVPTNPGYAEEGTYTVTLRVKDNSDPPLYSVNTVNVVVRAGHHSPVAVAIPPSRGASYAAKIGEPILLDGRASFSPDYPQDSVIAYSWDLDGDGVYGDATTDTITVTFNSEKQGQVGLRVYDTKGDSSSNIAYITIVASRRDLFVSHFSVNPTPIYVGNTVYLEAVVNNNGSSNTGANHVLVRFYDDNPLTTGNRLGGDFYVDLPVGAQETVKTSFVLPERVKPDDHQFYVYLDANNQFAEWDELNNIASQEVMVLVPPPHIVLHTECLNFATVRMGDSLALAFVIGNDGPGVLFIDSLISNDPSFWAVTPQSMTIAGGQMETLWVWFKPWQSGEPKAFLTVYTNDGNHTIILNGQGELASGGTGQQIFSGLASIEGMAAPVGTVVGAYRTDGRLITSYLVKMSPDQLGEDHINYALSLLEGQAGIADGDTIVFAIHTLDCNMLWERFCDPLRIAIFHPAFPPPEGYTRYDVDGVHPWNLSIPLHSGYNAISWNVRPYDQSINGIFGGLLANHKIKIVLDYINDGVSNARYDWFIPALGQYNPLQMTDVRRGYFVRMNNDISPETLWINGQPVCSNLPIWLQSGYNFISYLPHVPDSTGHVFASLESNFRFALDYMWNAGKPAFASYPNGDFNVMAPAKGYFANVEEPATFQYPDNSIIPSKIRPKVVAGGTPNVSLSDGGSLPLAVFAYGQKIQLNGRLVPKGTDIKAVDPDGVVCGSGTFVAPGVFTIAVYGDNPATTKDEGAKPGEMIKLYINDQLVGQEIQWTEFGDVIGIEGAQSVTGVLYRDALPTVFALHQNFPNPFNPTTSVRFDLPKAAQVSILVYDMLGRLVRTLEQGDRQAGYHEVVWDGRNDNGMNVASGIYTYRMTATAEGTTFTDIHKMIMIK